MPGSWPGEAGTTRPSWEIGSDIFWRAFPGTLVEIGSGTGPNLQYLPDHLKSFGIEPNPFMHRHFLREARIRGRETYLIQGVAEQLPFADETVDAVLSTLVLCSVPDLQRVFAEIRRVLKPGGQFLFLEHVAAEEEPAFAASREFLQPLWGRIGDGCQLNRSTGTELEKAGFRRVRIDRFRVPLPLVSPHIARCGRKVRGGSSGPELTSPFFAPSSPEKKSEVDTSFPTP